MLKIVNDEEKDKTDIKMISTKLLAISFKNGSMANVFVHPKKAKSICDAYKRYCILGSELSQTNELFIELNYVSIVFNPIDEQEFEVEGEMMFNIQDIVSIQTEYNEATAPKIIDSSE